MALISTQQGISLLLQRDGETAAARHFNRQIRRGVNPAFLNLVSLRIRCIVSIRCVAVDRRLIRSPRLKKIKLQIIVTRFAVGDSAYKPVVAVLVATRYNDKLARFRIQILAPFSQTTLSRISNSSSAVNTETMGSRGKVHL